MLKKLGLKSRVLLLALLPATLMAVLLGSYFAWQQQTQLQNNLLRRGALVTEQLAPLVAPALIKRDAPWLERIAAQALEQADVRSVSFLDPGKRPLAHAGPSMINPEPEGSGQRQLQITGQDATRYLQPVYGHHRDLAGDAVAGEEALLLGWVEVEISHSNTLLRGYRSLFFSASLMAGALILTGLLALRLGRGISAPVVRMREAISQLRDGNLEHRVPSWATTNWTSSATASTTSPCACRRPRKSCSTASTRPPKTCARTWKPSRSRTSSSTWRARRPWRPAASNPSSWPT